jgi:hypothetical protein
VLPKYSVQPRFGRDRLPTAIVEFDESFTNLCNLVAVKVNIRDAIALFILYTSVGKFPIRSVIDCPIH